MKILVSEQISVPSFSDFHRKQLIALLNAKVLPKENRSICHIIGSSSVGVDSDQLVYVLLSVFWEKIPVFIWAAKHF